LGEAICTGGQFVEPTQVLSFSFDQRHDNYFCASMHTVVLLKPNLDVQHTNLCAVRSSYPPQAS